MILYKHINNKDIAFEIIKRFYIREKDVYSIKMRWYRVRGDRMLWCMGIVERHRIARDIFRRDWECKEYQ